MPYAPDLQQLVNRQTAEIAALKEKHASLRRYAGCDKDSLTDVIAGYAKAEKVLRADIAALKADLEKARKFSVVCPFRYTGQWHRPHAEGEYVRVDDLAQILKDHGRVLVDAQGMEILP